VTPGAVILKALILFIALQHYGFMVLEMFYWSKPVGLKIFHQSLEKAEASRVLAANQGLYNGFLASGLIWAALHPDPAFARELVLFFMSCVLIAGVYGAYSVRNRRLFFIQSGPAIFALLSLVFS
jgi:putative membrane protein